MRVRLRRPAEAGERHERDEGQERRLHRSIRGDAAGRVVNGPSTAWRCVVSSSFSAAKARRASCLLVLADAGRLVCGALELLPDVDLDKRALLLDQDDEMDRGRTRPTRASTPTRVPAWHALKQACILRGAQPGGLPIQALTSFELVLNLKTAKSLDLEVSREFLLRANEVIE